MTRSYTGGCAAQRQADRRERLLAAGVKEQFSPAVEKHRLRWRDAWLEVIVAEGIRAAARGEVRMRPVRLGAMTLVAAVNELDRASG